MASLVADYGTSSNEENSDSEPDADTNDKDETRDTSLKLEKLPTPSFENNASNSIFSNPFKEEENAKQAILEKHVKMVNTRDNLKTLNGKKICWNYRKGRCRFGTKCSFAHDSDLEKTDEQIREESKIQQNVVCESSSTIKWHTPEVKADEDRVAKKRPGLTQGLVPGKKVMKMYKQQTASSLTRK